MNESRKIQNALISVYYKDGLEPVVKALQEFGINIYSTGGTQEFIEKLGIKVHAVEDLTGYPSILGGRVKTLHPKVFGGILARRENENDQKEVKQYEIPFFDLVIVDLYPFEETVKKLEGQLPPSPLERGTGGEVEIIEKIDIGGISLIRAAAKNFNDTMIVCDKNDFKNLVEILQSQNGSTGIEQRRKFAAKAFHVSSHYDSKIYQYFEKEDPALKISIAEKMPLRYGENPHQKATFYGNLNELLEQYNGKELSYNNLLDLDAAIGLLEDFEEPTVAIIKHNNPCGVASRTNITEAWKDALAADPVSAFGGIIALNRKVDEATALEMDKIFLEVLVAPGYDEKALEILKSKKNRIIMKQKFRLPDQQSVRSMLSGIAVQERNTVILKKEDLKLVTNSKANDSQMEDLLFADKIVKQAKSNTIVLARNKQLLGLGCGQTSRVDALKHAIEKAKNFGFDLQGSVMSSDAFFPFPDCVEIANNEGIKIVIQSGGSIKDDASIKYCNEHGMAMYFTGIRHFKH
ncbi:MAG: bifunctional phosphoribosylaminoimidazolecarboxamide formyltransferase/IMP cyclohydrolase [Bacteroidia bacterium]